MLHKFIARCAQWWARELALHNDFKWFRARGMTRKAAWFNAQNTIQSPSRQRS